MKGVLNHDSGLKVGCKRSRWELDDWKPRYFVNCLFGDYRYKEDNSSWKEKTSFAAPEWKQAWQEGENDESDRKRRGCVFKDKCHVKVREFTSEV